MCPQQTRKSGLAREGLGSLQPQQVPGPEPASPRAPLAVRTRAGPRAERLLISFSIIQNF